MDHVDNEYVAKEHLILYQEVIFRVRGVKNNGVF